MTDSPRSECLTRDEFEQLVAGELQDERIEQHVDNCPSCRRAVDQIRQDNDLIRQFIESDDDRLLTSDSFDVPTIDGYQILNEIHRGGQGIVYKAFQKATKRKVALKMLLPDALTSAKKRYRFELEIEVVARLRHPNIVTLYDSGETTTGQIFYAMEYIHGVKLDAYVRNVRTGRPQASDRGEVSTKRFGAGAANVDPGSAARSKSTEPHDGRSVKEILHLFDKICRAVQYAYQRGVIHRDLKPGNILVDDEGEPHVLDFGLAKAMRADIGAGPLLNTLTGEFMGTFAFAAPEQVRGTPDQVDARTDVYALGVMLYEALAGVLPYPTTGTLSDIIRNIAEVEPSRPSEHRPGLDDDVDQIVLKALSKDRDRRYQSAESLRRDIQRYLAGEPIEAKRDSTWYVLRKTMRRHRAAAAVAATFVFMLAGFAVFMTIQAQKLEVERDAARVAERRSMIESGRSAGMAGYMARAEEQLWKAHLNPLQNKPAENEMPIVGRGGPPDSYWALWELFARQPCLATWKAHDGNAGSVSFSLDGKVLASTGQDGTVKLWSMPTRKILAKIDNGGRLPSPVSFCPDDGRLLAWGNSDGTITLWNASENRLEATLMGYDEPIASIALNADGGLLASGGLDCTIRLWNINTQQETILGEHDWPILEVAFSQDGKLLASTDRQMTVKIWDLQAGILRSVLDPLTSHPHPFLIKRGISRIHFTPDSSRLAQGFGGQVDIWDIKSSTQRTCYLHKLNVTSVRFSPDGLWLASGSSDHTVKLWNVEREQLEHTYTGHTSQVSQVAFAPDSRSMASCATDGTIRSWEVSPRPHLRKLTGHTDTVHCVQFSLDERWLASSDGVGGIRVWDASSGKLSWGQKGHDTTVSSIAFHPNGHELASASYDKTLKFWDLRFGVCNKTIKAHNSDINSIAYNTDGQFLISGAGSGILSDTTVKWWNSLTGDHLETFGGHSVRIPCVCMSPNGKWLASTSCNSGAPRSGKIYLHDIATRTARALPEELQHSDSRALCFSPDSRMLASGGEDGVITLWDVATRKRLDAWPAQAGSIFSLAFHPEGRILASAGRANEIKLWDTAAVSDHELATLEGHEGMVFYVCFHPNGRILASGSGDKTVGLWDLTYYDRHIARNLEYQISRLPPDRQNTPTIQRLRTWADSVLARP